MSDIKNSKYPFTIRQLSKEEGGGYLIEYPDLPGCMSDGETMEEVIKNGQDAVCAWIEAATEMNRSIPIPGELENQSGKWVQRAPKSIHLRLVNKAKEEGVSLNTLVITLLAESLACELPNRILVKSSVHNNQNKSHRIKRPKISCEK
jgi:antitoxin HicB